MISNKSSTFYLNVEISNYDRIVVNIKEGFFAMLNKYLKNI